MATKPNAAPKAPASSQTLLDAPPVVQGQVIDPQKLPFDTRGMRYVPPKGAKQYRVRAMQEGVAGGRYRERGEEFDLHLQPEEKLPRWVHVLSEEELEPESPDAVAKASQGAGHVTAPTVPVMSHLVP